ncbi:MAG: hypothetical protein UZ14_CFX002001078 [Chloroflexi bacterium OLB14]|nr:MAG: hypothetical protein UZ14_CFX002001078 [Chloroflexi bacterium OLB14]
MENEDSFTVRVGTFFLMIGLGAFVLFVVSDIAEKVNFDYLFVAVLLIGIGWYMRRGKPKPPPAGRFAWIKKKFGKGNSKPVAKPNSEEE